VIEQGVNAVFNTEGNGNAWWIYHTMVRSIDEPLLVLTCDNVVELNYDLIFHDYAALGSPACMVVPVKPVDGLDGDYITHERNCILELNRQRPTDIYCSGIQVLNPTKVNALTSPSDDFYSVWHQLMAQRQLYCSNVYPSQWFAVDTLEQLNRANGLER
jgi:MurNAc alpha-1-phosphate uridylyltransferase